MTRIMPNGNVEITVQLFPDVYAELVDVMNRDGLNAAEAVNVAIKMTSAVSKACAGDNSAIVEALRVAGATP